MPSGSATRRDRARKQLAERHTEELRRRRRVLRGVLLLVLLAAVAAMMVTSRPTSSTSLRTAPDFTLTDTDGRQVRLSDLRGGTVLLYFNEGAGCGSCVQQMAAIEREGSRFASAGVTVLPIVMSTREQILRDMAVYGATTPFLLDDGTVSSTYGALGRGMHAGLPGHSFALIDGSGVQRWFGEYPSMWLSPDDLLVHIAEHLA